MKTLFNLTIKSLIRKFYFWNQAFQRLKKNKIAASLDLIENEQIFGVVKLLENQNIIEEIALWSCFFNHRDVQQLLQSESFENSLTLKSAAKQFFENNDDFDESLKQPLKSNYLSQNYFENLTIIEAISKNLKSSKALMKLSFCNIKFSKESMQILDRGLLKNKSVKELTMNYCKFDPELFEALLPSLCENKVIETLNFACNNLNDNFSYLFAKIVQSHSERRDEIVWSYSLRKELPPDNLYRQGLKQIILSHNNFSDIFAKDLILVLRNDLYMRSIDLKNNDISEEWIKQFVQLLDTNISLTNLDLRENPGFTKKLHRDIAISLIQNIQSLKEKGELELDEQFSFQDTNDIRSRFVKSNVLTIEIPKKFLKTFQKKLMKISNRECTQDSNTLSANLESNSNMTSYQSQKQQKQQQPLLNGKDKRPPSSPINYSNGSLEISQKTKASSRLSAVSSIRSGSKNQNQNYNQDYNNFKNIYLSEGQLEPIGEESKNYGLMSPQTQSKITKKKLNIKRSASIDKSQSKINRKSKISSVKITSPQSFDQNKDEKIISLTISDQKILNENNNEFSNPITSKSKHYLIFKNYYSY